MFSSFKTLPRSIIARFLSAFGKWFRIRNMRRVGSGCSWVFLVLVCHKGGPDELMAQSWTIFHAKAWCSPKYSRKQPLFFFLLELIFFIFWLHFTINESLFRLRLNLRPQNYSRMEGHITFSQVFRLIFFNFFTSSVKYLSLFEYQKLVLHESYITSIQKNH